MICITENFIVNQNAYKQVRLKKEDERKKIPFLSKHEFTVYLQHKSIYGLYITKCIAWKGSEAWRRQLNSAMIDYNK